jgi:hypothetical protein
MTPDDSTAFGQLLDDTCALLSRGQYRPNETSTAMFFRALREFDMPTVRAAFNAHIRSSKFPPTPAEILEAIHGAATADGRLGPEEAWALALTARDEADTVVWTDEIARSWNVARMVYAQGDEVGARMAFKESYARNVAEARAARRPLAWIAAEGFDTARRMDAVKQAAAMGRVALNGADILALPLPDRKSVPLLAYAAGDARAVALARLQAVRDKLTRPPEYVPSAGALAISETNARRQETDERVAAYITEKTAAP